VIAEALHWRGRAAAALGRRAEAQDLLTQAMAMKIALYGESSSRFESTREVLAELAESNPQ
jgi:hypothetical protein